MFIASTIYGISAIIYAIVAALKYDSMFERGYKGNPLSNVLPESAQHVLLLAIIIGFIMIPVVNTVMALKALRAYYRRFKRSVIFKSK